MILYSQTLLLTTGNGLQPLPIALDSQHTPIKGVTVDNSQSTVDVYMYKGTSSFDSSPVVIPRGTSRAFPTAGTSALYFVFNGVATKAGQIYIALSDIEVPLYNSQLIVIQQTYVPISAIQISGNSNLTGAFGGVVAAPINLVAQALANGQSFYLAEFYSWGLNDQPWVQWQTQWNAPGHNNTFVFAAARGDISYINWTNPIPFPTYAGAGTYTLQWGATTPASIIGTLNVGWLVRGYYF